MILKKDGSVYSWGLGLSGQLGFSYEQMAASDLVVAQQTDLLLSEVQYQRRIDFCPPSYSQPDLMGNAMNHDLGPAATADTFSAATAPADSRQPILAPEADGIHLYDRRY